MAGEDEFINSLNILLGSDADANLIGNKSIEKEITDNYDDEMDSPSSSFSSMLDNSSQAEQRSVAFEQAMMGAGAGNVQQDQNAAMNQLSHGPAPDQQIVDPHSMIGNTAERTGRAIASGWGDVVSGTGDTMDFISALVTPWEADATTSVGSWLKGIGTEYQNENTLILSESLNDITISDMFNGEFWSSKVARQIPFALSFVIPYVGGARLGAYALGRFGMAAAKSLQATKNVGTMGRGIGAAANKGSGLLGKLAFDGGKKGLQATKFTRNVGGFVGGGVGANLAEGAFLAGESYDEMLHQVDENGQPLFSPEEAAEHASGVMLDNFKYFMVDAAQYGLVFGGAGKGLTRKLMMGGFQNTPFKASVGHLIKGGMKKMAPHLAPTAAYAGMEGISEGIQELYQEWIKYTALQEAKGRDYKSYTSWMKDEGGNYRPEVRDIFFTSVGLGAAMGGSRGFFDSVAERKKMQEEKHAKFIEHASKIDAAQTTEEEYLATQYAIDHVIADNVWNYGGDGSVVFAYLDKLVSSGKMTQEVADEYKKAVEVSEANYSKHSMNSMLTESAAKQAFFRETRLTRNATQQAQQNALYESDVKKVNETITDESKKNKMLAQLEVDHLGVMETLKTEEAEVNRELEDLYTLRLDKAPTAKSTGKRDARYKKQGLTPEENLEYSQEAQKEKERLEKGEFTQAEREQELHKLSKSDMTFDQWKADVIKREGADYLNSFTNEQIMQLKNPSLMDKAQTLGGKALEVGKSLFEKAKTAVSGLTNLEKTESKEETKKPETKDTTIEDSLTQAKNWVKKNLHISKDRVSKIIEEVKKAGGTAADVISKLKAEKTLKGASKKVYDAIEKFANDRIEGKEGKTWKEFVKDKLSVDKEGKVKVEEKEEDVKKKDKTEKIKVYPKNKTFKKIEEFLRSVGGSIVLKGLEVVYGGGTTWGGKSIIIKRDGEDLRFYDFKGDILKLIEKNINKPTILKNIELRLRDPKKGAKDVVTINGKHYFHFPKSRTETAMYDTIVDVYVDGKKAGELLQRDWHSKIITRKAKKQDVRNIDKVVGKLKETKENIKKLLNSTFTKDQTTEILNINRNLEVYHSSGIGAWVLAQSVVQRQFPGARGYVVSQKLHDDYGSEASALALGSAYVLINEKGVEQTDLVHELGHIYYSIMENTPLMKRIKKLLVSSKFYQDTKTEYPELILFNYNKQKVTLGDLYEMINNNKFGYTSDLISIVENIEEAEKNNNNQRLIDLFHSLRIQLKDQGYKEVSKSAQKHIIEESFTKALEASSYGTVNSIIKNTDAQRQLKKDLIQFYKEVKNLTTEDEARRFLDLTVDNIQKLSLDAAIKHVLLDFNSKDRKIPIVQNSGYKNKTKAKKKRLSKHGSYSNIYSHIGDVSGKKGLTKTQKLNAVIKAIAKSSGLTQKEVSDKSKEYIKAIIAQSTRREDLKSADTVLDKELKGIGIVIDAKDEVTGEVEEHTIETARYEESEKNKGLPTTASNFIKKITEVFNHKNPDNKINRKKLLYALYALAKETMYDPFDYIPELRKSDNPHVISMIQELDRIYNGDVNLTNAKMMELKGYVEGINIEVLTNGVLNINAKTREMSWSKYKTTSRSLEASVVNSALDHVKDNQDIQDRLAKVYNDYFKKKKPSVNDRYNAANKFMHILLDVKNNPKGSLIDIPSLLNNTIMYEGKEQYLYNMLFEHTIDTQWNRPVLKNKFMVYDGKQRKFVPSIPKLKPFELFFGSQSALRNILSEGLVLSRGVNYLSMVDSVTGDGISVFNKENGLQNRIKNVANVINEGVHIEENDIMHSDNNIYSHILQERKNKNKLANRKGKVVNNPLRLTIHSGLMRSLIGTAEHKARAVNYEQRANKLNDTSPNELLANDFFMWLARYQEGKKNKDATIIYDQPIAVFSDKSRRYYMESIMAHDEQSRRLILSKIENNPAYKAEYADSTRVFPFKIQDGRIVDIQDEVKKLSKEIGKNQELFTSNKDYKDIKNKREVYEAFLTSYIANRFMAQQLFVHDHRQSKNEIDYVKRAAGAIASHTVYDRNSQVEFIITKDYFVDEDNNLTTEETDDVAIENDAMGYVLPHQAEVIRNKYGEIQKVGNVFKFVYHYTETEGNLKGKTTYMKFAVHVLTPELEALSPEMAKIGDILRARESNVNEVSKVKNNLIIAASESAAKLFKDGVRTNDHIYNIHEMDAQQISDKQDEIHLDESGYRGLSGEGLGIQLELDKQVSERFFPSQLFYNIATNIKTEEEVKLVNEMFELRKKVMDENNTERNKSLIMNDTATEKDALSERDSFKSSMSADVFGIMVDSSYELLDPRYPFMNASHNSIALGKITKNGTKMYTKGSIAYQSSSLGMGLQSYKKGLFKGDESIVASEAYVPGYLQNDGVKVGDLFIGTRVPAHGKVSSSVFVVKGFHKQIGNSPTSNITIPAHVSKNWGADLDGDSVHMNFQWTEKEVAEKEWRSWSNEFFLKYVELVSAKERQSEIKADIDFIQDSDNAISKTNKLIGEASSDINSQLTPIGDAQMFEDNVPAKDLVGMVAALQRSFNIFSSGKGEALPFGISIKDTDGTVNKHTDGKPIEKYFDNKELEGGVGNWFGVAQLLNIVLDNAKHQYASKLGLNRNSVFPYVLLRRLGFSLDQLSLLFNSPVVKEYMEFKRNRSKNYISKGRDINDMFNQSDEMNLNELVEFLETQNIHSLSKTYTNIITNKPKKGYNKTTWNKLTSRLDSGIEIDLNGLINREQAAEVDAILALYTLSKYNSDIVRPFSKAFTVHQTIEKNPVELHKIYNDIRKIRQGPVLINDKTSGGLNITYKMGDSANNAIVNHAMGLFDSILKRASRTDVRFTPYMQSILTTPKAEELLEKNKDFKSKIINQVIVNDLKQNIELLTDEKSIEALVDDLKNLRLKYPDNFFLHHVLDINEKGNYISVNRVTITEFTSRKTIDQIKESFELIGLDDKNLIFDMEYEFNKFGFTGDFAGATSFVPFFDNNYVAKINDEISRIVELNQTREETTTSKLDTAIDQVMNPKKGTVKQRAKKLAQHDHTITIERPNKRAKKIGPEVSYRNFSQDPNSPVMNMTMWAADKGIDLNKIDKESKTFELLTNRYTSYKRQVGLVNEFVSELDKKPLSTYNIKDLYDIASDFRKMDNSATKGLANLIEKEIGQQAFREQAEFLQKAGSKQGYEYNIPGEQGVPQEDLTNYRAWLGSNNMTSKRPEIQYLINETQKEYREYLKAFKRYKNIIDKSNNALIKSKRSRLTTMGRLKQSFNSYDRYKYIYGNIIRISGNKVRLLNRDEITEVWDTLSTQEQDYWTQYMTVADMLIGAEESNGMKVPNMQMGRLEAMSKNGLFGLYNTTIDSFDYERVKVYGTDKDGNRALKTFYEWKNEVYKGRTGKITLDSGKKIFELDKLREKAQKLKKLNKHEDDSLILLSDNEYDALVNSAYKLKAMVGHDVSEVDAELINEYDRRQGSALEQNTLNIHTALLEFTRSSLFMHGENTEINPGGFTGMHKISILTDSIIAFNKDLDNTNAVNYLTKWWKEGFLEKKKQESIFGKRADKVIDGFVWLTSLRLLGFNLSVGIGNILAGKYQELRKRGGKQFATGEVRFWKEWSKSRDILKKHRIIDYSFDDFVHLSEKKGTWGKIEKWSFMFMDQSEHYIQGSAFLGMLTKEEFESGEISEKRVMYINHKISTLHGEGYTSFDASMLSMYSYGRALLQFKKWFITLMQDRFSAEEIDRFGKVHIGSYVAAGEFANTTMRDFFSGKISMKQVIDIYNKSSQHRQEEIKNYLRGIGIGLSLLALIAMMEDDDEPDTDALRTLKKLSHDVFVTTDINRFVNYTAIPSSTSTLKNAARGVQEAIRDDRVKRSGPYGEAGSSKAAKTFNYEVGPYAEARKDFANLIYTGQKEKRKTSSLIR